ncbi:MAG: SDR family NAD(P)-dependent oxidoreductase [Candidatus Dormiibacterota bacterium]
MPPIEGTAAGTADGKVVSLDGVDTDTAGRQNLGPIGLSSGAPGEDRVPEVPGSRFDLAKPTFSLHAEPTGKSAVVTGATAGIGFQTARLLALRGATVLITGRDPARGADAVRAIRELAGHGQVEFVPVDHSTIAANESLARLIASRFDHLDVLVNNVGGIFPKRLLTEDGYEMTLAVNFLAPFVLTEALIPLLATRSGQVRCVNVVSSSFKMTKGDPFDDVQAEKNYVGIYVHGRAKLFTLLWTMGVARRVSPGELIATTVNPGMAWTPMTQSLTPEAVPAWRYIFPIVRFFQRRADPVRAARHCEALVFAEPADVVGRYFDGNERRELPRRFADSRFPERVECVGNELRAAAKSAQITR